MHEIHEMKYTIRSTDVDIFGNLRPSALLAVFQDLATEHSKNQGMDQDILTERYNAAWLLVRMWYRLERPLRMGEEITFRTWHRGAGGLIVYRDFEMASGGQSVGEAVSAWVVADRENRKMMRPSLVDCIASAPVPETVKDRQLKLIKSPKEKQFVHLREIRYSDLDLNGHMNNTRYADVIMDALTVSEMQGRYVSELQLNYSLECGPGECISISRCLTDGNCYVDGCSDDGARRFEAIVQLSSFSDLTEGRVLE